MSMSIPKEKCQEMVKKTQDLENPDVGAEGEASPRSRRADALTRSEIPRTLKGSLGKTTSLVVLPSAIAAVSRKKSRAATCAKCSRGDCTISRALAPTPSDEQGEFPPASVGPTRDGGRVRRPFLMGIHGAGLVIPIQGDTSRGETTS